MCLLPLNLQEGFYSVTGSTKSNATLHYTNISAYDIFDSLHVELIHMHSLLIDTDPEYSLYYYNDYAGCY